MSLSPACLVNSAAPPQAVSANATVNVALANATGVQYWFLAVIGTDETNNAATVDATLSINQVAKTATFTSPATLGSAVTLMSTVGISGASKLGAGLDANNVLQPTWTTTFKVNVLTYAGLAVLSALEEFEQNASFGWIAEINALIRAISGSLATTPPFLRLTAGATLTQAQSGYVVLCDTTSAWGSSLKLPTGANAADAAEFTLVDSKNQWSTNALPVTTDAGNVPIVNPLGVGSSGATANSLTLSGARASVRFKYDATQNLYLIV